MPEEGFPRMGPDHYFTLLERMHRELKPKTYFEIGTESGASLHLSQCTSYAVDPTFRLAADVTGTKPELYLFQGTSDEFFESDMLRRMDPSFDLAFLDGMHLFEFLLRDFMNSEKRMTPTGCIAMHDCVPMSMAAADRDWDKTVTRQWVGDVWKVVLILRKYRPDLYMEVVNVAPSGLVVVRNLDPTNSILDTEYDRIVRDWSKLSLADYGLPRLLDDLDIQPNDTNDGQHGEPVPARRKTQKARSIAIKTAVKSRRQRRYWGDWHFALSFSEALERQGINSHVQCLPEWEESSVEADLDLFILGAPSMPAPSGRPRVLWLIYPGKTEGDVARIMREAASSDLVLVASESFATKLRGLGLNAEVLHQAFDPNKMFPDPSRRREGFHFVGSNYSRGDRMRPIAEMAVEAGHYPNVYGPRWAATPLGEKLVADYVPNDELGDLYRGAEAILCDHLPSMRENGFISNRIFDALACGTPVICDDVDALLPEFRPFVYCCRTAKEFSDAVDAIRNEGEEKRRSRFEHAQDMVLKHSFVARAKAMTDILTALLEKK
ncbi:glycosyltransferase family protein [Cribrihabitans marinus]|uniref:glycosyltransferase family protein n=1 Tax=Cribrihabitans marinus TaxID=1227549 RepID=UPI00115F7982|nr:glycosyltransferase [Cribrihabitans marinus]